MSCVFCGSTSDFTTYRLIASYIMKDEVLNGGFREVGVIASKFAKFSCDEVCLINKKIQHLHNAGI